MTPDSILLVEDDSALATTTSQWLRSEGFVVEIAHNLSQARSKLERKPSRILLTDLRLEDGSGIDLIHFLRSRHKESVALVITGFASVEVAVEAVRAGAFDVLSKPVSDRQLLEVLSRATNKEHIAVENNELRYCLDSKVAISKIIGTDNRMLEVFRLVDSAAHSHFPILLTGESGTGKSVLARAIHEQSPQSSGPFIEVSCGTLPDALLESELFGHVSGAFTGATSCRVGKFESAAGGTLFLDEIATASPALQVKLLRVLQELRFEPLGGNQTKSVNARIIFATNENLTKAVKEGRFRQDLYYRINVIEIGLPALRDRPADIPILARFFLRKIARISDKRVADFDSDAMKLLELYSWPGNIRQLENVIIRTVFLAHANKISAKDLPAEIRHISGTELGLPLNSCDSIETAPLPEQHPEVGQCYLRGALQEPERQLILRTLQQLQWNRSLAAEKLGINRTTLYKKMKRLGLTKTPIGRQISRQTCLKPKEQPSR